MDTPEKTQIATPLSKFEDSPVFNYINSLSPIKPVKSIHITQAFNSLSFASLPSVFTSPHVSSHKESRFLKSHSNSDPSKPGFSSENGNKACRYEGTVDDAARLYDNSPVLQGNYDLRVSTEEASVELPGERLEFTIELPRKLNYDCGSPEDPTLHCGTQAASCPETAGTSTSLVPFVEPLSAKGSPEVEVHLKGLYQIEEKKEVAECDWEGLISDAADLLIFTSPTNREAFRGLFQKSLDPSAGFCTSLNEGNNMQGFDHICSGKQQNMEDLFSHHGDCVEATDINQTLDSLVNSNSSKCMASQPSENVDNEAVSNLCRGIRRRCLDFEIAGARRTNLDDGSSSSSSVLVQSDEKIAARNKKSAPVKFGSNSSRRTLPGIGLHLNALAITSKDGQSIKHENASSGISVPSSATSVHSLKTGHELNDSLNLATSERDVSPADNGCPLTEDVSPSPAYLASEEFNQSSPKKKRRKLEGEIEGCKRCNCKKSKCLKLYCECFAAGVYCIEPCACQDCFNKPIHEETVLSTRKQIESRNPLAFAPKVIRGSEFAPETGDDSNKTPASARHKRGCNCKKSNCLKKYCECYQGGVGCSINCRCEGCKNAFGRKDGSTQLETEAEQEDEQEACENTGVDEVSQKTDMQNTEEETQNPALPTTPLQLYRSMIQLPFSSKVKPLRSFLKIGSSSGFLAGQKYGKPKILRPQAKFDKQFQTVSEDDMPEILRGNLTPSTGIKTSPNGKRVSPPHSNLGSSPSRRSGRKLILQSIPSFPSLTPQH